LTFERTCWRAEDVVAPHAPLVGSRRACAALQARRVRGWVRRVGAHEQDARFGTQTTMGCCEPGLRFKPQCNVKPGVQAWQARASRRWHDLQNGAPQGQVDGVRVVRQLVRGPGGGVRAARAPPDVCAKAMARAGATLDARPVGSGHLAGGSTVAFGDSSAASSARTGTCRLVWRGERPGAECARGCACLRAQRAMPASTQAWHASTRAGIEQAARGLGGNSRGGRCAAA
jgi:hypothetical protein